MDLVRQEGLPAVVVNPSAPVGPRDIKPTPTGKMIRDAAAGRVPAYIDTGLNMVHVDDVAEGHLLALERGQIGERYVLGGENLLLKDILALVADVVGRRAPRIEVPEALVWPAAWLMEGLARLTGIPPMMTRDHIKMARHKMYYSSAKAMRELGYAPRPLRAAVAAGLALSAAGAWPVLAVGPAACPGASRRGAADRGGDTGARRGAADRTDAALPADAGLRRAPADHRGG